MNKTTFSPTQTIKQLVQVAFLLWLVLLAACMAQEQTSPTSILSVPIQETEIVQITVDTTPIITATLEQTTTATTLSTKLPTTPTVAVTPTALEPSATPMATNTPLPTATLTAAEQQQRWLMVDDRIAAVMASNNGCQLPCWWGIEPGDTVAHARQIFNTIDETSWEDSPAQRGELKEIGYFGHPYRNEMGEMIDVSVFVSLIVQDDQIVVFNIYSGSNNFAIGTVEYNQIGERLRRDWEQFSIQSMFETYGEPALIYILPNEPYYDVNIYYPNLGVAASYRSEVNRNEQGERMICHNMLDIFNIRSMNLFLYDPLVGLPPGYVWATYQLWPLNPEGLLPEDRHLVELGSVENNTGRTIGEFVAFVLENEGEETCFIMN